MDVPLGISPIVQHCFATIVLSVWPCVRMTIVCLRLKKNYLIFLLRCNAQFMNIRSSITSIAENGKIVGDSRSLSCLPENVLSVPHCRNGLSWPRDWDISSTGLPPRTNVSCWLYGYGYPLHFSNSDIDESNAAECEGDLYRQSVCDYAAI